MTGLLSLEFTLPETVAIVGLAQSLMLIVYMVTRARRLEHAGIPALYFLVLGVAFYVDLSDRFIGDNIKNYGVLQTVVWFATIPFSLLVIRQIALVHTVPSIFQSLWILLVPLLPFTAITIARSLNSDPIIWAQLLAVVFGAVALLSLWDTRALFQNLYEHKLSGRDRYWLVLSLILLNVVLLVLLAGAQIMPGEGGQAGKMARGVLGIGLIYVASTCLFRIYPQAVRMIADISPTAALSEPEKDVAVKIENLLRLDKVYQEPAYGRMELARELGVSESQLSRIINLHFDRSLPQLLNEYRVNDAKRLLTESDTTIKTISEDVGFNSLASFNRVFKDMTGQNPSEFRDLSRDMASDNHPPVRRPYAS